MVLAAPGSGKTLVITRRTKYLIENHQIPPSQILVITFTKAAAEEMQQRFEKLMSQSCPVTFGTFHSVFFRILKYAYGLTAANIVLEEQKLSWMKEIVSKLTLEVENEKELISNLLGEISLVKGEQLELEHYYAKSCSEEVFQYVFSAYEKKLRSRRLIDFDDMLVMTYELLTKRPDILSGWQKRYCYILIDEFQDINLVQYKVIQLLAEPEKNLFIVGDDDQSIYRFRGARPEIMLNFTKDYPDAQEIMLDRNYRSTKEILLAAMNVIVQNKKRFPKTIGTDNEQGVPPEIVCFPDALAEGREIAEQIRHYQEMGYAYSEMAVLFRTNTDARLLAEKLMEYNIPFCIKDALPDLYEHWIAKNIFSYIRIASGSRERSEFLQIINKPKRYISRECLDTPEFSFDALERYYEDKRWMIDKIEQLRYDIGFLRDLPPFAAISYIRKGIGYEDYLKEYAEFKHIKAEELIQVLDEIQESAEGFLTYEEWFAHIVEYKKELENQNKKQACSQEDKVVLTTLHSSKGLEYDIVFIINANEGVMPHQKAALEEDLEEERRMFYVGMTRARKRLHICYVKERFNKEMQPSRFVLAAGQKSSPFTEA